MIVNDLIDIGIITKEAPKYSNKYVKDVTKLSFNTENIPYDYMVNNTLPILNKDNIYIEKEKRFFFKQVGMGYWV